MDFERALKTQQLRLLRLVAGLFVLIGFLSVGPVSRSFSDWTCQFVGSILSRAEAAARYLVIAHAHRMVVCSDHDVDQSRLSESLAPLLVAHDADASLSECQSRLKALRAVLLDLPREALRLLRRIEKQARRAARTDRPSPPKDVGPSRSLHDWRLAGTRIERPPDTSPTPSLPLNNFPPEIGREAFAVG